MEAKKDFTKAFSYIFVFALALLFTLQWGPGSRGCSRDTVSDDAAATVNGTEISMMEFRQAYASQMGRLQGRVTEEMARQMGFQKQVLDQMVLQELLFDASKKLGVEPDDAELKKLILENPDFHVDGKFDFNRYKQIVKDRYGNPQEYENRLRRDLASSKVLALVEGGVGVSEDEIRSQYQHDANRANITYVRFRSANYASKVPAPKPAELQTWISAHGKEISQNYEENKYQYEQPEQVQARHILIKADKAAPEDQQKQAKERIDNLAKEVKGGKDFAELAKQFSEDPGSREKGGDLGFNDKNSWVPEFSAAAFALEPGKVSEPVQSPFGWHLIKVEAKKPATTRPLKEVEAEIAKRLFTQDKAKRLARADAEKALAAVKAGKKLSVLYPPAKTEPGADTANTPGPKDDVPHAEETNEFAVGSDFVPSIGSSSEMLVDLNAIQGPKTLEKIYDVQGDLIVADVTSRSVPSDEKFPSEREKMRESALEAKRSKVREAYFKELRANAKVSVSKEISAGTQVPNPS